MKRFLSLLATGALALGLSSTAMAQTRGIGAGALVLDDYHNHTVVVTTPPFDAGPYTFPPTTAYDAWEEAGFPTLNWYTAVPPFANAQAGFLFPGPLSQTGPLTTPYSLTYWVGPGQAGFNNSGGYAGAWDHATTTQLGLVSGSGTVNVVPKWGPIGSQLENSTITDNGANVSTTEPLIVTSNNAGGGAGDANQVLIQGSTNNNQQLELGYNTTGNFGTITSILQGGGGTPLYINPATGNVGVGYAGGSALPQTLSVNGSLGNNAGNPIMNSVGVSANALNWQGTGNGWAEILNNSTAGANHNALGITMADNTFGSYALWIQSGAGLLMDVHGNGSTDVGIPAGTTNSFGNGGGTTTNSIGANSANATIATTSIGAATAPGGTIVNVGGGTGGSTVNLAGQVNVNGPVGLNLNGANVPFKMNGNAGTLNQILTSNAGGNTPSWTAISSLVQGDNGVLVSYAGGVATAHLGAANTDVPFTSNRFVNLNASNLSFTTNGGAKTALNITGGASPQIGVGIANPYLSDLLSNTATNTVGSDNQGNAGVAGSFAWVSGAAGYTGTFYNPSAIANADGVEIKVAGNAASNVALDVSQNAAQATAGTGLFQVLGSGAVNVGIGPTDLAGTTFLSTADVSGLLNLTTGATPIQLNGSQGNAGDVMLSQGAAVTPHWVSGASTFILNQNASAQTPANFWISGSGKLGGTLTVGGATQINNTLGVTGLSTTAGISNTGAFTTSGGAASINDNSNFATTINTGTSNGSTTIGNIANGGSVGIGSNTTITLDATNGTNGQINIGRNTGTNVNIGNGTSSGQVDIEVAPGTYAILNNGANSGTTLIGRGGPGGSGQVAIEAGNGTGTVIDNGGSATTEIGDGANTGLVTIGSTTGGGITMGVNSGTTNLTLNGIATDAAPLTMLTLNGANQVRATTMSGTADQGVIFNTVNNKYELGGALNTDVPFTSNRFINLDASNLSFTTNGGTNTALSITGGASPQIGVGITNPYLSDLLSNTPTNTVGSDNQGNAGVAGSFAWVSGDVGYTGTFFNPGVSAGADGLEVKIAGNAASNLALDVSQNAGQSTQGTSLFDVLGNGRVGIGTSTPSATLGDNIVGLTVSSDDPGATGTSGTGSEGHQLTIQSASSPNEELEIGVNTSVGAGQAFSTIQAYNQGGPAEPLVLQPAGSNVGIGAEAPATVGSLDIAAPAAYGLDGDVRIYRAASAGMGGTLNLSNTAAGATGNAAAIEFNTDGTTVLTAGGATAANAEIKGININGTDNTSDLVFTTFNGATTSWNEGFRILGYGGVTVTEPGGESNPAITINNSGSGNDITGTGNNWSVDGSGNISTNANINMVQTNPTGSAGVITMGGARWLHNAGSNNAFVGLNSGNFGLIGSNDVGVGPNVLQNLSGGSQNTGVGAYALVQTSSDNNNTGIGYNALNLVNGGSDNTGVGNNAGQAGAAITSGSQNTLLGSNSQVNNANAQNQTAIGYGAVATADNSVQLGNGSVTLVNTSGTLTTTGGANITGTTNINTGTSTATTTIGNSGVGISNTNIDIGTLGSNLNMTGITADNTTTSILSLDALHNVRTTNLTSAAVTTAQGTANQIFVNGDLLTHSGAIIISTPQDIATTSSPTFNALTLTTPLTVPNGGTGQNSFTSNGVMYGNGVGALNVTGAPAANNVLLSTGGAPLFQTLATNASLVGNGVGTSFGINLSNANTWVVDQTFATDAGQSTALVNSINQGGGGGSVAATHGGTGQTTLTTNGVVYGNGGGPVGVTALGAAGTVLHGTGGAPSFSKVVVGDITGGANNTFLTTNGGGAVGWNALNVDGTTLLGNGSSTALSINLNHANTWIANQTFATTAIQSGALINSINQNTGVFSIAAAYGGTGQSTLTTNGVMYGNGVAPVGVTAPGAVGTVLHGNGGAPSFSKVVVGDLTGGANNTFLTTNGAGAVGWNGLNVDGTTLLGDGSSTALAINLAHANNWTAQQVFTDAAANAAASRSTNTFANAVGGQALGATIASTGAGAGTNTGLVINAQNSTGANQGLTFTVNGGAGTHTDIVGTGGSWNVTAAGAITAASLNAGSGAITTTGTVSGGTGAFASGAGSPVLSSTATGANAQNTALTLSSSGGTANTALDITAGGINGAGTGAGTNKFAERLTLTGPAVPTNDFTILNNEVTANSVIIVTTEPSSVAIDYSAVVKTRVANTSFVIELSAMPATGETVPVNYIIINP